MIFVLANSVVAGCFLAQESPSFCTDVTLEEAREECDLIECDVDGVFSVNGCSENSLCETVLCKTTCSETLKAECLEPLEQGEFEQWCGPGCCFYGDSSDSCFYSINRWECLNNARNSNEQRYSFEMESSPKQCSDFCKAPKRIGLEFNSVEKVDFSSIGVNLKSEVSGGDENLVDEGDGFVPAKLDFSMENEGGESDDDKKEDVSYSLFFFLMFVFAAVGVGIYYFNYQRQQSVPKVPGDLDDDERDVDHAFISSNFLSVINFLHSDKARERIKSIKKRHNHKLNQMRHNQEFVNFGLDVEKKHEKINVHSKKLKRLVSLKKLKQKEKIEVKNIEKLSGILASEREELEKKSAFNKNLREKKKGSLEAIEKLKKFSKK